MNLCNNFCILVLIRLCGAIAINGSNAVARGFLIYRTVSVTQSLCNCPMSFSCSCCQSVIILYTKREKNLCVNFTYQRNGLNVDVALSSDTINTRTITNRFDCLTDYKAFQFCMYIPGCLFSTACVNILELNRFSKSITACLRLDIYSKKHLWQINYGCTNVSTELPMISMTDITPRMTDTQHEGVPLTGNGLTGRTSMTESMTNQMMTMAMPEASSVGAAGMTGQANGMTEMSSGQTEQTAID
ncbi:PREDICTED: uncharacterized protein LOC106740667 [Dinoponera quadriceps]|uniref:Uncharacterized protein LOC106740667 n=1 Tax=Dinoponera quadriceps TaxID=609295 RepID=A0A6P3WNJ5_DINQU|nr:PREDICTED: uncharacterized protein LOC106740667 [Dinoponera quadriceps]